VPEVPPHAGFGFRTIGELAERCGHYCWIENRLFALTGMWASTPAAAGAAGALGAPGASAAIEAEIRVIASEMSSWHGFVAGQWRDRLPVRAGVDADALVVPPPGPLGPALDLLEAETDLTGALGGLAEEILPALLAAYDEHFAHASPVSEAPVCALIGLVRPRIQLEIEGGCELLLRGRRAGGDAGGTAQMGSDMAGRLQRVLGAERTIFPGAWAS
jgi:hypothetical protein